MKKGFALPTVLIASVVLLMVLAVSVTATTAARNGLKTQYYTQLAQAAGEAGVAFATACLQTSNGVPTWTNAKPLTSATNCNGDVQPSYATSVMENGNIRSKFSVGLPPLDADGRALTIPQTGYVEVLRASTGAVWRTYQQPSSQQATVPALCSGAARSDLGWNNATLSPTPITLSGGPVVPTISVSPNADVYAGKVTYRKDFSVVEAGAYTLKVRAAFTSLIYIDGQVIGLAPNTGNQLTVNLTVGCHVITIQEQRVGTAASYSGLAVALQKSGTVRPIVISDRSWRTSVGNLTNSKLSNYYEGDATAWPTAFSIAAYNAAPYTGGPTSWVANTADGSAAWASSTSNGAVAAGSYSYFRANPTLWNFGAPTTVRFTTACDGKCTLYVDGQVVSTSPDGDWTTSNQATVTLGAGQHQVFMELINDGSGPTQTAFLLNAKNTTSGATIDRSGTQWTTANRQTAASETMYSYEANYRPSPDIDDCNCANQGTFNALSAGSYENSSLPDRTMTTSASISGGAFHGTRFVRNTVSSVGAGQRVHRAGFLTEPGAPYTLSTYTRSNVATRIGYAFISRNGWIPYNGSTMNYGPLVPGDNTWKRISITTPPLPPGTTQVLLLIGVADNSPVGTVFDIDATMMSLGPTLYPYADESSPGWRTVNVYGANMATGPVL